MWRQPASQEPGGTRGPCKSPCFLGPPHCSRTQRRVTVASAPSIVFYLNFLLKVKCNIFSPESVKLQVHLPGEARAQCQPRSPPEGAATLQGHPCPFLHSPLSTSLQTQPCGVGTFEMYVNAIQQVLTLASSAQCSACEFPRWFCRKQEFLRVNALQVSPAGT